MWIEMEGEGEMKDDASIRDPIEDVNWKFSLKISLHGLRNLVEYYHFLEKSGFLVTSYCSGETNKITPFLLTSFHPQIFSSTAHRPMVNCQMNHSSTFNH